MALAFLAEREEPEARAAVLSTLNGDDDDLQQAVLQSALLPGSTLDDPQIAVAIAHLLKGAAPWPLRVKAASALGAMPRAAAQGPSSRTVLGALREAGLHDDYALVRQASLRALHDLAAPGSIPTLVRAARSDPEAKVREAAQDLLGDQAPLGGRPAENP
jgi:HEAT repeat protein